MYKIFIFIQLVFLFKSEIVKNQTSTDESNSFSKIEDYRHYLINKNPNDSEEFGKLLQKWEDANVKLKEIEGLTSIMLKDFENRFIGFKSRKKDFEKRFPESKLSEILDIKDYELIKKNIELLDLIAFGILKSEYPFPMNRDFKLFDELKFYDIKVTDKIGEVGAGTGRFSLVLKLILTEIELFVNELKRYDLAYIERTLSVNKVKFNSDNISLIKGNKKSTNLEGQLLDKLILRNSFHHFSKKEKMLNSIKMSMKEDGELFLCEKTIELAKNDSFCKKAMKSDKIKEIMKLNGFSLIDQKTLKEEILYKFKLKK